jgi:hypothetical protein
MSLHVDIDIYITIDMSINIFICISMNADADISWNVEICTYLNIIVEIGKYRHLYIVKYLYIYNIDNYIPLIFCIVVYTLIRKYVYLAPEARTQDNFRCFSQFLCHLSGDSDSFHLCPTLRPA